MIFEINNHIWQLRFVPFGDSQLRRSDGTYTLAVTDSNLRTVFVCRNLSAQMIDKVLCHELTHVHAMEYQYSMPIEVDAADFVSLHGRNIINAADILLKP